MSNKMPISQSNIMIRILYKDQSVDMMESASIDNPCARKKIRSLLRRRGCEQLELIDATGDVVLVLKAEEYPMM